MKIKINESNYGAFRNEIVKRRTFKLLVQEPLKYTVHPKPSGVVLKSDSDTTVHKQDAVEGVRLKSNPDTIIYKQSA
jgi:hypothetical protein